MTRVWPVLVGLVLPLALILGSALLVPDDAPRFLGISLANWCLFACAPITAALLSICYHRGPPR